MLLCRSFDDMRAVHSTLEAYKGLHFSQLMVLYGLVFLFMQVFIIPGCFFVTVLLGSLIPVVPAVTLVTVLTTIGCVINYEVAQYLLADVLLWMFPRKVRQFQDAVAEHQSNLFNYLLFLRSVPILPSWLINVGSPLANVPLRTFVAATMLGFQPTVRILHLVYVYSRPHNTLPCRAATVSMMCCLAISHCYSKLAFKLECACSISFL